MAVLWAAASSEPHDCGRACKTLVSASFDPTCSRRQARSENRGPDSYDWETCIFCIEMQSRLDVAAMTLVITFCVLQSTIYNFSSIGCNQHISEQSRHDHTTTTPGSSLIAQRTLSYQSLAFNRKMRLNSNSGMKTHSSNSQRSCGSREKISPYLGVWCWFPEERAERSAPRPD